MIRSGLRYGDVEYIDSESRLTGRTALPAFDLAEYIGKLSFIPQPAASSPPMPRVPRSVASGDQLRR